MRHLFIATIDTLSHQQIDDIVPWACMVVQVDDGYHAFESKADYHLWASRV